LLILVLILRLLLILLVVGFSDIRTTAWALAALGPVVAWVTLPVLAL
jgi:hypothetical protein